MLSPVLFYFEHIKNPVSIWVDYYPILFRVDAVMSFQRNYSTNTEGMTTNYERCAQTLVYSVYFLENNTACNLYTDFPSGSIRTKYMVIRVQF